MELYIRYLLKGKPHTLLVCQLGDVVWEGKHWRLAFPEEIEEEASCENIKILHYHHHFHENKYILTWHGNAFSNIRFGFLENIDMLSSGGAVSFPTTPMIFLPFPTMVINFQSIKFFMQSNRVHQGLKKANLQIKWNRPPLEITWSFSIPGSKWQFFSYRLSVSILAESIIASLETFMGENGKMSEGKII